MTLLTTDPASKFCRAIKLGPKWEQRFYSADYNLNCPCRALVQIVNTYPRVLPWAELSWAFSPLGLKRFGQEM